MYSRITVLCDGIKAPKTLKWATTCFLSQALNSVCIEHPTLRRYTVRAVEDVVE
jgi:hypothetical protein